jgi:hypothetical protein
MFEGWNLKPFDHALVLSFANSFLQNLRFSVNKSLLWFLFRLILVSFEAYILSVYPKQ